MEIERKYLLTSDQLHSLVTDLDDFVLEVRYYLFCENDNEIRLTKRDNDNFMLDRMQLIQNETNEHFVRKKDRIIISEAEFEALAKIVGNQKPVERLHLKLNDQIELKVYQGRHSGLIRAEVEFECVNDANAYTPNFEHSGEITNTPVGRDALLAKLEQEEVAQFVS